MDKDMLLSQIRATHAPIEAAEAALDDEALAGPAPGMEGWARKDVLAHLEWWNDHSTNVIAGNRSGIDPYPGDDEPWDPDAWNARILAENRDRSAADVRRGEADSFARLLGAVEGATDGSCSRRTRTPGSMAPWPETVIADSTDHYPEHVPHLA